MFFQASYKLNRQERLGHLIRQYHMKEPRSKILKFVGSLILLNAIFLLFVALGKPEAILGHPQLAYIYVGFIGLAGIGWLICNPRVGWSHAVIWYTLIFWLFHFGLVFFAGIFPWLPLELSDKWWRWQWLWNREAVLASIEACIFLLSFLLGFYIITSRFVDQFEAELEANKNIKIKAIFIGSGCLGVAEVLFLIAFFNLSGIVPYHLLGENRNYLNWASILSSFGFVLLIAGKASKRLIYYLIPISLGPIWLYSLATGARTGPFVGGVILLRALIWRGFKVNLILLIGLVIFSLGTISFIREIRTTGVTRLEDLVDCSYAFNPVLGIMELGGSLKPVYVVIERIELGEKYRFGATYLYPFYRQFLKLKREPLPDPKYDPLMPSYYFSNWGGSIGFSTVAEAYYNAGTIGVIIFAFLWGGVLGFLHYSSKSSIGFVIENAFLIPMIVNIRNSFIFVLAWIFVLSIIGLIACWPYNEKEKRRLVYQGIRNLERKIKGL
ncbi:MAG: O-antigen polysaccharide polymerase Wzy [Candidatus Aminicenantes bacterium]|nr:O-antigen polysaccharide polymerase Wzy [Candidatus Aminicenantes bacterium]